MKKIALVFAAVAAFVTLLTAPHAYAAVEPTTAVEEERQELIIESLNFQTLCEGDDVSYRQYLDYLVERQPWQSTYQKDGTTIWHVDGVIAESSCSTLVTLQELSQLLLATKYSYAFEACEDGWKLKDGYTLLEGTDLGYQIKQRDSAVFYNASICENGIPNESVTIVFGMQYDAGDKWFMADTWESDGISATSYLMDTIVVTDLQTGLEDAKALLDDFAWNEVIPKAEKSFRGRYVHDLEAGLNRKEEFISAKIEFESGTTSHTYWLLYRFEYKLEEKSFLKDLRLRELKGYLPSEKAFAVFENR